MYELLAFNEAKNITEYNTSLFLLQTYVYKSKCLIIVGMILKSDGYTETLERGKYVYYYCLRRDEKKIDFLFQFRFLRSLSLLALINFFFGSFYSRVFSSCVN